MGYLIAVAAFVVVAWFAVSMAIYDALCDTAPKSEIGTTGEILE